MSGYVYRIIELDSELGKAVGHEIFIVADAPNCMKVLKNVACDKNKRGIYTTAREVQYA